MVLSRLKTALQQFIMHNHSYINASIATHVWFGLRPNSELEPVLGARTAIGPTVAILEMYPFLEMFPKMKMEMHLFPFSFLEMKMKIDAFPFLFLEMKMKMKIHLFLETFPKMETFPLGNRGMKSPFSIRDTY